ALAATGGSAEATVGYASTYIYGVLGALAAVALALRHARSDTDAPVPIVDKPVAVDTVSLPTATEIAKRYGNRITFSRRRSGDDQAVEGVGPDTEFGRGDLVNVVGPRDAVDAVA